MTVSDQHSSANQNSFFNPKQLVVCSLAAVPEISAATKATALVSVLNEQLIPETPPTIAPDRHFKLGIDDIETPYDGLKHAELTHIDELCQFAQEWHSTHASTERISNDQPDTIVVHCYAGISRSTAAAFVMLCALNPSANELTIAKYLRNQSNTALPNRLIVDLGDEVLGRNGRMTKAIRSIDNDYSHETVHPFALNATLNEAPKRLFFGPKAA